MYFFSGDIYLSFGISISCSIFECNSLWNFFETPVILSEILLPVKSPVASAVFHLTHFEAVFIASAPDLFAVSRSFCLYLLLMLLAKSISFYIYSVFRFDWISHLYYLITRVKFILSPVSNSWLLEVSKPYFNSLKFWINCFKKEMIFLEKFLKDLQIIYLEQRYIILLDLADKHY